ncbi:hypothetical protein Syun_018135 [Stephania yunnanensis]|uniref:Uncharacterized protein n=1 Tax=Stephania yunnanensis TaxID=152371 RepID=A0AAP0NVJ0_9MAGN
MVLWEITLATAYFLGLKRTYRLALKLQRRLISPRHPKIRQFLYRFFFFFFFFFFNTFHRSLKSDSVDASVVTRNRFTTPISMPLRTRGIFDLAMSVHRNIQQKDLEVGRNLGNWILQGLHRVKPSAQIRPQRPIKPTTNGCNTGKHLASSSNRHSPKDTQKLNFSRFNLNFNDGRLRTLSRIAKPTSFPTLASLMRPVTPASTTTQYRQLTFCGPYMLKSSYSTANSLKGVFREDIAQWMLRN